MKHLRALVVLGSAIASASCTQPFYVLLDAVDTQGVPTFCLNDRPRCSSKGYQVGLIDVREVDDEGEVVDVVWRLASQSGNGELSRVKYGDVPPGWAERAPAKQLKTSTWYRINSFYYFCRLPDGTISLEDRRTFHSRIGSQRRGRD